MDILQSLFGIKKDSVRETCVLLPLLGKHFLNWFSVKNFSRGALYGAGNTAYFTLIYSGLGPALSGDAVLYLSHTRCKNIILFGSCGLVQENNDLKIGDLVTPTKSYSLESFSEMLKKDRNKWRPYEADNFLLDDLSNPDNINPVQKVICASVGSLKLEREYIPLFKEKRVQAVDMESAAIFAAARYTHRKAVALFYVTDIIDKKPFYIKLNPAEKSGLTSSIRAAIRMLCDFIKNNSTV